MLSIKQRFFNPVQNYFVVTILVNASKPRFKGSYSDVRRSPHRMHSVSVRRGPHKKRILPNNQCSIVATAAGRVECTAAWSGRTNVTEKRQTVGRYERKLPARYESAVLHNPYLGCKHNVKEVPLAWQQLQFFAIYCYLTGSPHDKGN